MSGITLGIVGFGKIASEQHVPAIEATHGLHLAAIADPRERNVGLPSYHNLAEMLEAHPEIQAVALCTPPSSRADLARQAIGAGRHVLLEKPTCATVEEAIALAQRARLAGTTLFTAWHSQEAAGVRPARAWLAAAVVHSVQVTWKEDVRVWHPGQRWLWEHDGFGVFDPGINALSILSLILPGELQITDAELFVPANCATPIAAHLALRCSAGFTVAADFDFRQAGPQSWEIDIETDRGALRLSHGGNRLEIAGQVQEVGPEREYEALYNRFGELIRSGESAIDLVPLRLTEDALRNGRTVPVEAFEE